MLAIGIALMSITAGSAQEPDRFRVTTHRPDDRITWSLTEERVVFKIQSPVGISKATIARTGERWPETVVLHLRLNGLESIRIVADSLDLRGAVSSQTGEFRIWKGSEENALLDSESPYWVEHRFLDRDGNLAKTVQANEKLPAKEGLIELRLPKALFEANPDKFTVHWIDFYR